MNTRSAPGTIDDWIRHIGGAGAVARWQKIRTGVQRGPIAARAAGEECGPVAWWYVATATVLLQRSRGAAAFCGNKDVLGPLRSDYYERYFDFALERPGLSVVRLFPKNVERRAREDHNGKRGVEGLLVPGSQRVASRSPHIDLLALDLGFVLFRHSAVYSAILHWNEGSEFCWVATSDPLLNLLLRDEWGAQLARVLRHKGAKYDHVRAFAHTFGIRVPA